MIARITIALAIVLGMASASFAAPKSSLPKNGDALYFKYATGSDAND